MSPEQTAVPESKATWLREVFQSVDWLIPAFLNVGFCELLARAIETAEGEAKLEVLRETMAAVYGPQYLATMYLERYSKVTHICDFANQIDECFRAFLSGYKIIAVTSMIPVLEGIIRKIATSADRDVGSGTQGLVREFKALVEEEKSSTSRFEERLVMFELLLEFMEERFLKRTDRYDGLNNFNRHGILHGVFEDFGEELNFLRIIMLLDLLLFTIMYRRLAIVSVFSPEDTDESKKLAKEFRSLRPVGATEPISRAEAAIKLMVRVATRTPEQATILEELVLRAKGGNA